MPSAKLGARVRVSPRKVVDLTEAEAIVFRALKGACRDCLRLGAPDTVCVCPRCSLDRKAKAEGDRARRVEALKEPVFKYGVYRTLDGKLIERFVYAGDARNAARRFSRAMREGFRARRLPKEGAL